MHFTWVASTINRPHFIAERDGDVILLNFCPDHMTMRSRTLDHPPEETTDSMGGFGTSIFGFADDRDNQRPKVPKSMKPMDMKLSAHTKHGLGADTQGKVYYLDDSPKTETTYIWRVISENGDNEYTQIPSGFITRFSDSDYFVVSSFRDSHKATIYQWRTRANADIIKTITIPRGLSDHTRLAYGSKIIWVKIDGDSINVHVLDVITETATNKNFTVANAGDPTARWFCAKNNLLAVISGRLLFIGLQSLTCDKNPTNLEPNEKHHPFGVDSNGNIYVLSPTKDGCSVQRARDVTLASEVETRVVIPKMENNKAPRTLSNDKHIMVHFNVSHRGRTLLDQSMQMLTSQTIGEVVRKSPEIIVPPETRLKIFYNNEECISFRTPLFLKMKDGDTIYAQFIDKEPPIETNKVPTSAKEENTGFFSREELQKLEELRVADQMKKDSSPKVQDQQNRPSDKNPPHFRAAPEIVRAPPVQPTHSHVNDVAQDPTTRPGVYVPSQRRVALSSEKEECVSPHLRSPTLPAHPSQANGMVAPVRNVQRAAAVPLDPVVRLAQAAERKSAINEKLLVEMQWLRSFVNGDIAKNAVRVPENHDLEKLQKKYARALLMIGRSEVQK